MCARRLSLLLAFLLPFFMAMAQNSVKEEYKEAFAMAYEACPDVPQGWLEAISFTNTQCHYLTDDNYSYDDANAMPRAYGLMGLVKDGKGYFRENLSLVAELSGLSEAEILANPKMNVLAYAKAFERLAKQEKASETKDYLFVIQQLSELPIGEEKDIFPMQTMLYSVCMFLNDADRAEQFGFDKQDIDLKEVFDEHYDLLSAEGLQITRDGDYPQARWIPAPDCNYSQRTDPVSGVVIHYTEGSYAGCISWFQNCDASVSAHYVIRSSDGQVTQMVREADKAWHARSANAYTIGIEHEAYGNIWSYFTEAMYQSSADLVRDICSRYESIDGHRTFYRDTLDSGACLNNGLHDLGGVTACTKIRGHQHYPDQSHTDPGPYWDWNHYYKLINEGTSVILLEGESGSLDHQNYGDDERKIWVIWGPDESKVSIDFKSFQLEKDYDFLWIYDGMDVFSPKIGRWNTKSPGRVEASGNVMCIEFRSDCATTTNGWQAEWKAELPTPPEPEPVMTEGLYPNPAFDKVTFYSERDGFTDVVISDMLGNRMLPITRFIGSLEIDISSWTAGIYMVNYGSPGNLNKTVKLVKLEKQ